MIICYTVPEIWCMMDIIIFHFELFFALELFELFFWDIIILHKCTINNNHMIIWLLRYQLQQTNFFAILGHFWPFYLSNSPKNENIKKWKKKKTPRDIIILHDCTNNYDYRLYCSWDMACNIWNFYFSFWTIFYRFTRLTAQKMKISQIIIGYTVLEI